jgi:hypothetical protein
MEADCVLCSNRTLGTVGCLGGNAAELCGKDQRNVRIDLKYHVLNFVTDFVQQWKASIPDNCFPLDITVADLADLIDPTIGANLRTAINVCVVYFLI